MNNMILAFEVVFPLMLMMSVGCSLQRFKITDTASLNVMNKVVFRVFLPLLLFLNIYSLKPQEIFIKENIRLLILTAACVFGTILLTHFLFKMTVKDKRKSSVMIQGIFRSNLVLFGIPITASIYGEEHIGTVSLLAAVIVPLYNILAVILLEAYRDRKIDYKILILGIIKNPLVMASALAFLFLFFQIHIPGLLMSPLESMSKVATPLAFVVLGGTFRFDRLSGNRKHLAIVTIGRLILFPAMLLMIALLLGYRNEAIVALIGAGASPTAVSSFTMAMEMDADGELAGQIVVVTSVASIVTIFLWVLFLKTCQFI